MNPYLIEGPTLYSFSGGRTSGYLLKHAIDAHGGKLPDDHVVCFANTGREMPETLDFVQECSERWNVRIVWLEYDPAEPHSTKIVSHNSAARNGEPFEVLIGKRKMLPNPVMRFCTIELKIRRMAMYAQHHLGWERWNSIVGLRADEKHRTEGIDARNAAKKDRFFTIAPLVPAEVAKQIVLDWWSEQPFDLRLTVDTKGDTILGNCDLCFMKGRKKVERILTARPRLADWWKQMEHDAPGMGRIQKPEMALFRADRPSYAALQQHASMIASLSPKLRQAALDALEDDDRGSCTCHD